MPGEQTRLKVEAGCISKAKNLHALKGKVEDALSEALGADNEVELVPAGSITRTLLKAQRVLNTFG